MEKNAIIFLVISLLILLSYPILLEKWFGIGERPREEQKKSRKEEKNEKFKETNLFSEDLIPIEEEKGDEKEKIVQEMEIWVETDLFKAILSNRGGIIKTWELKKYKESIKKDAKTIQLLKQGIETYPMNLIIGNENYGEKIFDIIGDNLNLKGRKNRGTISFIYQEPNGKGKIQKELTFYKNSYRVDINIFYEGIEGKAHISLGENFGINDWGKKEFVGFVGPISLINGKVEKDKIENGGERLQHFGKVRWAALQDKYFISAVLLKNEIETSVITEKLGEDKVTIGVDLPKKKMKLAFYAGPKENERLKKMDAHLEEAIDYGWFIYGSWSVVRLVAQPLFSILNFFYQFTHNYGFSIILLTCLIKTLFIPLTHKSYSSMKGMQAIQPQMQALQKKYKNDKERLNKEMLSLYKNHKVNPLGGCLPIILQIPVFIALFNILYTTIELRQAPFILWVKDLSDKDPFFVLPIIMGATMFIQQKIQPTPMDPRQAKIMMFLPFIFTFLFLNFSSGLVLYWMTNNILTITQQYITIRFFQKR